jgi:hypothetical protein
LAQHQRQIVGSARRIHSGPMVRSTFIGSTAGLVLAALMIGVFAAWGGVSQDLILPSLVMGLPVVLIGSAVGVYAGAVGLRQLPRRLTRSAALSVVVAVIAMALRLMGLL